MDLPAIETTQHINRDHMEMCRFTGPDDTEFKKIASALVRMADGLRPSDQGSQKETTGSLTKSERKLLLDSLEFDRIDTRRLAIKSFHPRTCGWLLEQQEYMDWTDVSKLGEHHGFLWIRGHAGTGKSTLMNFALERERKKKDKIIISFFFSARGQELERSMLGMYRSLLLQLLAKAPRLQRALDVLSLTMVAKDGHEWSIESLKSVLEQAVMGLGKTSLVCYIDALDECDESDISDMLSFFETVARDVTANGGINLRVCISSRHFPAFDISTGLTFDLEGQRGHKQDIVNYVDSELKLTDYDQAEQLRTEVKTKAKGVFMWAALVVDLLNKEYNRGRLFSLQEKLTQTPTGLHSLFHEIMTKDSQDNEDLLLCVQWMLFSQRPLRPEELYHVIIASGRLKAGAEPQPAAWGSFVPTIEVIRRLIVDTSKGLVEVTLIPPTVQFIHESVRDYLLKEDGLVQLWPSLGEGPGPRGQCHERLKACCLAIMDAHASDDDFHDTLPLEASPTEYHKRRQAICESSPLLQYAASNLLYHADRAEGCGVSQNTFLEMLGVGLGRFIDITNIFEQHEVRRHKRKVPLLYLLAEANCPNLCRIHPDRHDYLLMTTERHYCALFAARAIGNDAVVSTFLDLHATTAWRCTEPGPIRDLLHQHFVEVRHRPRIERSDFTVNNNAALAWSEVLNSGDETLLFILLTTPHVPWPDFLTGPTFARGGKLDARTQVFLRAAWRGQTALAKLLIALGDVDTDARDADGMTALAWAAKHAHVDVVSFLLGTGRVDADARDADRRTPLWWAARAGHVSVARLLHREGNAQLDARDVHGWTPLSWAAEFGRLGVVRYLVESGEVEVDGRDHDGWTPLTWAASKGRLDVVRYLVATGKVDVEARDKNQMTPLQIAARDNRLPVVEFLIREAGADAGATDCQGTNALCRVVEIAQTASGIVLALLATGKCDPRVVDERGHSALSLAQERLGEEPEKWAEVLRSLESFVQGS